MSYRVYVPERLLRVRYWWQVPLAILRAVQEFFAEIEVRRDR